MGSCRSGGARRRQRAQDAVKVYEEAAKAAEEALKEMEAAKQSVLDLGEEKDLNEDRGNDFKSIVSVHPYRPVARVQAPDEWITDYCSGREKPLVYSGDHRHTSLRVDLEVYSGRALDWFEWIDLFHSLVHQTGKAPGDFEEERTRERRDGRFSLRIRWR